MISVIVPIYQVENYIEECFYSLAVQSYKEFELIFIDDGSQDESLSKVIQLQLLHPELRVKVETQCNQGVSVARNRGLDIAEGDWVTFVDGDDWVRPTFLERLWHCKEKGDLSVVGIGGSGFSRQSTVFEGIIEKDQFVYSFWFTELLWGSVSNKLYDLSLIQKYNIRFEPGIAVMEDMLFNMYYCQYISKISIYNQPLYHYRLRDGSTMHSKFTPNKMTVIKTFRLLFELDWSECELEILRIHQVNSLFWLLRQIYMDGGTQALSFEQEVLRELEQSDLNIFFKKGWKKGIGRYGSYLLYRINPVLYQWSIRGICYFRNI
ncbi:glycosyltransferase family 2 protein [Streptococcus suis]